MKPKAIGVGATIQEAVREALDKLGLVSENDVEIEVLREGKRGLFRSEPYVVVATKKNLTKEDKIRILVGTVLELLGVNGGDNVSLKIENSNDGSLTVRVEGLKKAGQLIGKKGQTIEAMQHLLRAITETEKLIFDVEGYMEKRIRKIKERALLLARRVVQRGRKVVLDPMPAHERKIVHLTLKDFPGVQTYSIGREPARRVVIAPADTEKDGHAGTKAKSAG